MSTGMSTDDIHPHLDANGPPCANDAAHPPRQRVEHTYRDFSRFIDEGGRLPKQKKAGSNFPAKLQRMLSDETCSDIITWMPHGRAWKILDKQLLLSTVIPAYFGQTRFESFTRQLSHWGFRRLHRAGPDFGCYYHQCFLRGLPRLTALMRRVPRRKTIPDAEGEPNFYLISKARPLPPPAPAVPPGQDVGASAPAPIQPVVVVGTSAPAPALVVPTSGQDFRSSAPMPIQPAVVTSNPAPEEGRGGRTGQNHTVLSAQPWQVSFTVMAPAPSTQPLYQVQNGASTHPWVGSSPVTVTAPVSSFQPSYQIQNDTHYTAPSTWMSDRDHSLMLAQPFMHPSAAGQCAKKEDKQVDFDLFDDDALQFLTF